MKDIWEQKVSEYKNALQQYKSNHNSGDEYIPADWETINRLSFLHNYVSNRPVQTTLNSGLSNAVQNMSSMTPTSMNQRSLCLQEERVLHQRSESQSVWRNPSVEQRKCSKFVDILPPTMPRPDEFAEKKIAYRTETMNMMQSMANRLNTLSEKVMEKMDSLSPYKKVLIAETSKINENLLNEFYDEATDMINEYE